MKPSDTPGAAHETEVEMKATIHIGKALDVLRTLPEESVQACVTDPPYGIGFMGQKWDYRVPDVELWREVLRVLAPGGHLVAFGGSRTYHRMAVNVEDAGFEIRDQIMWLYGSGFPKSLDVSKAIDKAAGEPREVVGVKYAGCGNRRGDGFRHAGDTDGVPITAPTTPEAEEWSGWGTALKPAHEPIILARKPFSCTVAENILEHGTGALNIDACRVGTEQVVSRHTAMLSYGGENHRPWHEGHVNSSEVNTGRWPANVIHDGSEEVLEAFPDAKGQQAPVYGTEKSQPFGGAVYGEMPRNERSAAMPRSELDRSAARFFYCAKASSAERGKDNNHPTVKPIALMEYLVQLVTPPGSTVLDPFSGSGTTGLVALAKGHNYIGIEINPDYAEMSRKRIQDDAPLFNAVHVAA